MKTFRFALILTLVFASTTAAIEPTLRQAILDRIEELRILAESLPSEPPVDPEDPEDPEVPDHDPDIAEHVPDFSDDPNAIIVATGETLELDSTVEVSTMIVLPGGTLVLHPGAEIVFLDVPIRENDMKQHGNGLIVIGAVKVEGTPKTEYARATTGITAGATSIVLDQEPTGWNVGDKLALPGTRQTIIGQRYSSESEVVTLTAISGNTIEFTPAQFSHFAGPQEPWMTPHVANLSRDIVLRSENPDGIRGHIMLMHGNQSTDFRYCEIRDMGRTDGMRILNTTDNRIGRYPFHYHLMGDGGQHHKAEGLVVTGSPKWAYSIHRTNMVTLKNCIAYDIVGGAFVTEDATEMRNRFDGCVAIKTKNGTQANVPQQIIFVDGIPGGEDIGRDASGFWARGGGNDYVDCIVADCEMNGFSVNGSRMSPIMPRKTYAGLMERNEVYSTFNGYWFRQHFSGTNTVDQGAYPRLFVNDSNVWNCTFSGANLYRTSGISFRRHGFYSDPVAASLNPGVPVDWNRRFGDFAGINYGIESRDYPVSGMEFRDCHFGGFNIGILLPFRQLNTPYDKPADERGFIADDVTIAASVHIAVESIRLSQPYRLTNITFLPAETLTIPPVPEDTKIWLHFGGGATVAEPYWIYINGERYWYEHHPAEGREPREGVIGLVSQE